MKIYYKVQLYDSTDYLTIFNFKMKEMQAEISMIRKIASRNDETGYFDLISLMKVCSILAGHIFGCKIFSFEIFRLFLKKNYDR